MERMAYIEEKSRELGWKIIKGETKTLNWGFSVRHCTPVYAVINGEKLFITNHYRHISGWSILPIKEENEKNDRDAIAAIFNFVQHEGRYITDKAYYSNRQLYWDDPLELFRWLTENNCIVPQLFFTEERQGAFIVLKGAVYECSPCFSERCPTFRFEYRIYDRGFCKSIKNVAANMRYYIYEIICEKGHECDSGITDLGE